MISQFATRMVQPVSEVQQLERAIGRCDFGAVRALLARRSSLLYERDVNGWSAVHFAARAGSVELMQLLVEAGAALQVEDLAGLTPLAVGAGG